MSHHRQPDLHIHVDGRVAPLAHWTLPWDGEWTHTPMPSWLVGWCIRHAANGATSKVREITVTWTQPDGIQASNHWHNPDLPPPLNETAPPDLNRPMAVTLLDADGEILNHWTVPPDQDWAIEPLPDHLVDRIWGWLGFGTGVEWIHAIRVDYTDTDGNGRVNQWVKPAAPEPATEWTAEYTVEIQDTGTVRFEYTDSEPDRLLRGLVELALKAHDGYILTQARTGRPVDDLVEPMRALNDYILGPVLDYVGNRVELQEPEPQPDAITALARRCHANSRNWFPSNHADLRAAVTHCTLGLAGEAGEVANKVKKLYGYSDIGPPEPGARRAVVGELVDTLIYDLVLLDMLCDDIPAAIEATIAKCVDRWGPEATR